MYKSESNDIQYVINNNDFNWGVKYSRWRLHKTNKVTYYQIKHLPIKHFNLQHFGIDYIYSFFETYCIKIVSITEGQNIYPKSHWYLYLKCRLFKVSILRATHKCSRFIQSLTTWVWTVLLSYTCHNVLPSPQSCIIRGTAATIS